MGKPTKSGQTPIQAKIRTKRRRLTTAAKVLSATQQPSHRANDSRSAMRQPEDQSLSSRSGGGGNGERPVMGVHSLFTSDRSPCPVLIEEKNEERSAVGNSILHAVKSGCAPSTTWISKPWLLDSPGFNRLPTTAGLAMILLRSTTFCVAGDRLVGGWRMVGFAHPMGSSPESSDPSHTTSGCQSVRDFSYSLRSRSTR